MIEVKVQNCNNITSANLNILKDTLNIRYAMNGTGKSTIAKAIELTAKNEDLSVLKTFGSDLEPRCEIGQNLKKVLLFNEDFVNTIVFRESEVIQNAFEIFIKSPEYELKQKSINDRLREIHIDTSEDQDIGRLLSTGQTVLGKFSKTKTNDLKQTGLIKSLTNSESIFKLPEPIKKFQPLMEKDYNVEWVGWKNDGGKYDDNNICPFCTAHLETGYRQEKQIFSDSYSKSNVKNIKEMISYFDAVSEYMDSSKSEILYRCVKETEDEEAINLWVKRFYFDLEFLVTKIRKVIEFNSHQIKSEEISKLGEHLRALVIDGANLDIFNNDRTMQLIAGINTKISKVILETESLKEDIGSLKGLIGSSISRAVKDINDFLDMAGIDYCLEIMHVSEKDTKTILKYKCKDKEAVSVDNIKLHLSWGERNAFALVLFMHYAISQDPDLIILDDPISSFDSNKKYAIINRLFLNNPRKKSLFKKSALMLTHDFQPVIDFVVNSKPHGGSASACFLRNDGGIVSELEISEKDIKSLPILLSENAANSGLNKIHRITCLRKLLEHTMMTTEHKLSYNLLSCLLKGKQNPTYADDIPMSSSDISKAEAFIQSYITDFTYSTYTSSVFNKADVIKLFREEKNDYYRLQVFRVLLALTNLRSKIDDPILKYIDEQFHVENDYIFYLDFNRYNIVPDFVLPKCIEFLNKEGVA